MYRPARARAGRIRRPAAARPRSPYDGRMPAADEPEPVPPVPPGLALAWDALTVAALSVYFFFVHSFARGLLGEHESAVRTLQEAVARGENTAYRFERHALLSFRALAADPTSGPRFQALLQQVRGSLRSPTETTAQP